MRKRKCGKVLATIIAFTIIITDFAPILRVRAEGEEATTDTSVNEVIVSYDEVLRNTLRGVISEEDLKRDNIKKKIGEDVANYTGVLPEAYETLLNQKGVLDEELMAFGEEEINYIKEMEISDIEVVIRVYTTNTYSFTPIEYVDELYGKLFFTEGKSFSEMMIKQPETVKCTFITDSDEANYKMKMLTNFFWLSFEEKPEYDAVFMVWDNMYIDKLVDKPYTYLRVSVNTSVCKKENSGKPSWKNNPCKHKNLEDGWGWGAPAEPLKDVGENVYYYDYIDEQIVVFPPFMERERNVTYVGQNISVMTDMKIYGDYFFLYIEFKNYKENASEIVEYVLDIIKIIIVVVMVILLVILIIFGVKRHIKNKQKAKTDLENILESLKE